MFAFKSHEDACTLYAYFHVSLEYKNALLIFIPEYDIFPNP